MTLINSNSPVGYGPPALIVLMWEYMRRQSGSNYCNNIYSTPSDGNGGGGGIIVIVLIVVVVVADWTRSDWARTW